MNKFKFPLKFIVAFCISVFFIITITMLVVGILLAVLINTGVVSFPKPILLLVYVALLSIVLSTIIARIIGEKVFAPVKELTHATREVAKGNFSIKLEKSSGIEEVRDMISNFNVMTRELEKTEIIHNDFTQNVSHEFKTPLASIEGYAALLQNKNLSEEKQQQYVSKIIESTRRLSKLAGNILELSRLENQKIELKKTPFSLDEQLRQMILMQEQDWSDKRLDLDIDLESVSYWGNEEMLFQVWQNIFGNAVKFSPDQSAIHVLLRQDQRLVTVIISDNGTGMSKEIQQRIFEKFYQGDNSHTTAGNGLGLALAKRIVELHGGKISVSSAEGEGTSFTVTLPK